MVPEAGLWHEPAQTADFCSTKQSSAMPPARSILLVSQQDVDHVQSAIVPIMQALVTSLGVP